MNRKITIVISISISILLFGCAPNQQQLTAWKNVEKAKATAWGQRGTDRIDNSSEIGKITILPAPIQLPMVTTTVTTEAFKGYTEDLGDVDTPATTTTTTKVDTTALAIQQLGLIANTLAKRTGAYSRPQGKTKQVNHQPYAYQSTPMPTNNAVGVIKATGEALERSGLVSGLLTWGLSWIVGDTIQEVARTPSHDGDYVQLIDSYNPITTKITETNASSE